jgi:hypothetical protein
MLWNKNDKKDEKDEKLIYFQSKLISKDHFTRFIAELVAIRGTILYHAIFDRPLEDINDRRFIAFLLQGEKLTPVIYDALVAALISEKQQYEYFRSQSQRQSGFQHCLNDKVKRVDYTPVINTTPDYEASNWRRMLEWMARIGLLVLWIGVISIWIFIIMVAILTTFVW